MNNTPDIIGIIETWLKTDLRGPFMDLHNYNFISMPQLHIKRLRGWCLCQKKSTFMIKKDISFFTKDSLESILIEI